ASLGNAYGTDERRQFDALTSGEKAAADDETGGPIVEEFDIDFTPVMVNLAPVEAEPEPEDTFTHVPLAVEKGHWEIRFAPHRELYARANDPLLLFRELANLGELTVVARLNEIPALSDFEPFGVYCSWELTLVSPHATVN